jgi:hypothetical protein
LLNRPSELPDLRFQAVDTHRRIAPLHPAILCDGRAFAPVLDVAILRGRGGAITVAENAIEEPGLLSQSRGRAGNRGPDQDDPSDGPSGCSHCVHMKVCHLSAAESMWRFE